MIFFFKSFNFWHRKLTLKVQFGHFLMNHNSSQDCFKTISSEHVDSWAPSLKFHNRTDINLNTHGKTFIYEFCVLFTVCVSFIHGVFGIYWDAHSPLPIERLFWKRILSFLQFSWAIWIICGSISQLFHDGLSLHLSLSFRRNVEVQCHTQGNTASLKM